MMIFFETPYCPEKEKAKKKLRDAWLKYLTPIWKGGDVKMNRKIQRMVKKGKTPPL